MKHFLLGCLIAAAAFSAAAYDDPLPPAVAAALAHAGLPPDALGAVALPLTTRWARPWRYRAGHAMPPASTMKLVTSVVALDRLGPNLRGRTELLSDAPVDAGVLRGDLVLRGGADPDLGLPQLWQMLFELRQQGVTEIAGDLVIDRTLFRPARIDLGLAPFDESPEWAYNMIPDALMLAGNLMGIALASDQGTVRATLTPPLEAIEIDAGAMVVTDKACTDWDDDWQPAVVESPAPAQWRIALRGGFPRHCTARAALQLIDRSVLAERQVRAVWASLGGRWQRGFGAVREAAAPAGARVLATHTARPWGEVLRGMNKRSDNAQTRLLFLQLGVAAMAAEPGFTTRELAQREVERWFDERQIDRAGLVIDNGSGLSRSERISAATMGQMLAAAHAGRHAPELLMSLPVAGVDGTMRRRLKGSTAEGWARLKTGTLRDVSALAGYVRDSRGDTWALVALLHHDHAAQGRAALDALVEWVATSGARWR